MLDLKELFDNRYLAHMLLKNWRYDKDQLHILDNHILKTVSIYPYIHRGERKFLKFLPAKKVDEKHLIASIDFVKHLLSQGHSSERIYLTKKNEEYVYKDTPWGRYLALSFKEVPGRMLKSIELTDTLSFEYGKSLASLHTVSQEYKAGEHKRPTWKEILQQALKNLKIHNASEESMKEAELLLEFFSQLPKDKNTYGLIHNSYNMENVYYDRETKQLSDIDFSHACYHWFIADIKNALMSIEENSPNQLHKEAKDAFLSGYSSLLDIDEELFRYLPIFKRFTNIVCYSLFLSTISETWDNEPESIIEIRFELQQKMNAIEKGFLQPIDL